ncbi:MAG: XRE family transcriptional regulator [Acidihalobacter sp.]|uniref:XRE family transcriptional regulator n=1 Tax=Acidihalobacter sp. TaxID=1872108 RepID=UPI00307F2818
MSISAQIGQNVARIRATRNMSLSALAERSSLSKATLSELERGAANPTISTVWALANALDVPFGELVSDAQAQTASLADESATVHLIEQHLGPSRGESYLLQLAPDGQRMSAPHGRGVREQATVLSGRIKAGPIVESVVLDEGEILDFDANLPHGYFSVGGPASVLVRMEYPETPPLADDNLAWQSLPRNDEQWGRLETRIARLLLASSQSGNAHSLRLAADTIEQTDERRLRELLAGCMQAAAHQPVQGFVSACPKGLELIVLPIPTDRIDLGPPPHATHQSAALETAFELHALRSTASLTQAQTEHLLELRNGSSGVERTLAAEILATLGLAADNATALPASSAINPWLAVSMANLAIRHLPASSIDALVVDNHSAADLQPMLEELCPVWRVKHTTTGTVPADTPSAHALLAFDVLQQGDAVTFLHQAGRSLAPVGLLLIAEDLTGSFAHPRERAQVLMRHHLTRLLPPLARLARADTSAADGSARARMLLDRLPSVLADALHGNLEQAIAGINRLRRDLAAVPPDPSTEPLVMELEALGRTLNAPEELATHPLRLIQLAEHAGLRLLEHHRVRPSDGPHKLDAGTHLFAFARRGVAPQP